MAIDWSKVPPTGLPEGTGEYERQQKALRVSEERIVERLKLYLRPLLGDVGPEEFRYALDRREKHLSDLGNLKSAYVCAPMRDLRAVAQNLVIQESGHRIDYRAFSTQDLVDRYVGVELGPDGERLSYLDLTTSLVFVRHFSSTPENKVLERLTADLFLKRLYENRITVILAETPLREVEALYRNHGCPAVSYYAPGSAPVPSVKTGAYDARPGPSDVPSSSRPQFEGKNIF